MSLSYQITESLDQVDTVLTETDPTNAQEAQSLGDLATNAMTLRALKDNPPPTASLWSLIPAIGLANIACPGGDCLELIDSEPSLYKEQCVSGLVSTANPCSEYLATIEALLSTIGDQLFALGQHAAADVVRTAGDGVGNILDTSTNVTRPTMGDLWSSSPDWMKAGTAALLALLLVKVLK